ncbi:hypothetical protein BX265_7031 [Streptomyces sp. TLI_235]|nr:hypothetical protein BX265_7031 [Streptomyces sp. TLI_235]
MTPSSTWAHPFWNSVPTGSRVEARTNLKHLDTVDAGG